MTTVFAEHRLSVQREIEKQLATAAQHEPSGGSFWDSSRINISYENQSVPPPGTVTAPQRTATASAVSPVSMNQAFSATPLRAATAPPASTSQRTIMTVLAVIALLAGGGSVLVLRYMRPSTGPASTAMAEMAPVRGLTPENPAAAPTPVATSPAPSVRLPQPPSTRLAAAPNPAANNASGRSTATGRREASEIVRSFPNEPSRGTSRRSAAASTGKATSSLESTAAPAQEPATAPAVAPPPAATVTVAPPAPGTLDSKAVAATIRAHGGEVQECFERARMNRPDLQGRLTIQSTISPDGRPLSTSVTSNIEGGARLESCVSSAWQSWTFPAPAGGVNGTVRKTFTFE
jgi:hypothetical protein